MYSPIFVNSKNYPICEVFYRDIFDIDCEHFAKEELYKMTTYEMQELLEIGFEVMKKNLKDAGITLVATSRSDDNRAEIEIIAYQEES